MYDVHLCCFIHVLQPVILSAVQIEEVRDHPFTCLVLNIRGIDPDDALSIVPYEKGSTFLMYLEQKLGGPGKYEINRETNVRYSFIIYQIF